MLFLVFLMYIPLHLVEVSDEVSVYISSQSLLIIHLQFFFFNILHSCPDGTVVE